MKRIAVLLKERCNPKICNYLCIRLCPVNRAKKDCIIIGEDKKPIIDELLCTGCGICVNRCPTNAIKIVNLPAQLDEDPIHRYGKNGFALYRLISPMENAVVGIIGRNGIGKSTALKIIAGIELPNLGEGAGKPISEILPKLRGTEIQGFLEKLSKGEILPIYKPQRVDLIRNYKIKVRDLLLRAKAKEKEEISVEEIAQKFGISNILDRPIDVISGGELQKVAIAALFLKEGNLFLIDEPSNYLDIKQRLFISNLIRSLTSRGGVVVVDHDLLMMDYMADYIQIFYGIPSVYGVVTHLQSAKRGINQYLDGYLEELNIRFRDKPVVFDVSKQEETKKEQIIASWENAIVQRGDFSLSIEAGNIRRGEIIVALGENGIGKTTFVEYIKDKKEKELKIAYKPQYLDSNSILVMEFLRDAWKYEQLIKPLGVEHLKFKTLDQLSGGELQRVYIAKVLSEEADLYLIDEPSSYLDIEERLALGSIIKDMLAFRDAAAIIVEHDLLLALQLGHRFLIFEGTPAIKGNVKQFDSVNEAMNLFLKSLGITMRRDKDTKRPRINKQESRLDREQKQKGKYFSN